MNVLSARGRRNGGMGEHDMVSDRLSWLEGVLQKARLVENEVAPGKA